MCDVESEKSSTFERRIVTGAYCTKPGTMDPDPVPGVHYNCPYKKWCIKGNNCKTAFSDRNKKLAVSRKPEEKRVECLDRITGDFGTQLRMNRSIQAEGFFANVKEDMNFRRYLYRGKENVLAQSTLLAIGFDINKLHHKIMSGRTGTHLFELKKAS